MNIINPAGKSTLDEGQKLKARVSEIQIELDSDMTSYQRIKLVRELADIELKLLSKIDHLMNKH